MEYGFFCVFPDTVHPPDPLRLVFSLKLFRDALAGGVLLDKQVNHLICRAADLLQVVVQLAVEQHSSVDAVVMLS